MKVVINLSEDEYNFIKQKEFPSISDMLIRTGTPLPKEHGRLIDANSIYQIVRPIEQSDAEWGMTAETAIRLMHDVFDKSPTVIEADKEESEDKE